MQKLFENPKTKVIVISAASFLALAVIIVTIACFSVAKSRDNDSDDFDEPKDDELVGAFAEKTESTKKTQNTTKKKEEQVDLLLFESNNDGTCTVIGIGDYEDSELIIPAENAAGETVAAISDGAFEGCEFLESITIPATVKSIGSGAFSGCSSLESFTVSSQNTKYCAVGGVLFNKNKTTLICYPASRVGKSYLLSTNVKTIAEYAFDGVQNLTTILYEGSTSKFHSIEVESGNRDFSDLSVTCNYVAAK